MNEQIFFWFYYLGQKLGSWPVYFLASLLPWFLGLGLIIWFLVSKHRLRVLRIIFLSLAAALGAWFLTNLFKYNLFNPRPFEILGIVPIITTNLGDAWPSGHATFMSALAVALWSQDKKIGIIFFGAALVVGLARIMAGVHYPLDVLSGWLLGSLVGYGLIFVLSRLKIDIQGT